MSNVIPRDFIKHEVENEGDWSEWVCPDPTQYFMKCCDCGLVHEMQFKVVKYSEGDECDGVDDPDVQAVFRARRVTPPAAQQEPVAWANINKHGDITHTNNKRMPWSKTPLYTTSPAAQRQPLTEEELLEILGDIDANTKRLPPGIKAFARAIEAAHGIK